MKQQPQSKSLLAKALLLCLAVPPLLSAQTAAPAGESAEDTIVLSPFEVNSEKDVGYLATNTLAGSRLNTELKDTAAAISVLTPEFLKDIGATNMKDVILFQNNAVPEYGDSASNFNGNPMIGNPEWQLRIRGHAASYARNYFLSGAPTDFYNIDRVDQSRGPNSVLFGFGAAGGIVNSSTKQAVLGRNFSELELTTGSWNRARGAVDSNLVLANNKLAVRFNGVVEDSDGWRKFEYYKQERAHLAAKWRISPTMTLRAEAEVADVNDNWARPWLMVDQAMAWRNAGSPVYDSAQWSSDIVTQTWSEHLVYVDNTGVLNDWNEQPFSYSQNQGWVHMAMTKENLAMIPIKSNPAGPDADRHTKFHTISAYLEGQLTKDLSYELAYNHQRYSFLGYDANGGNLSRYGYLGDATGLFGDASTHASKWIENPATQVWYRIPNPNSGDYYIENNWTKRTASNKDNMLRATLAWHLDAGSFGDHRLALMAERDWKEYDRTEYAEVFAGAPFASWDAAFDSNRVFRRHYITPGDSSTIHAASWKDPIVNMVDPVSRRSLSSAWAPNQDINNAEEVQDTFMLATQSAFFNKRLIATAGLRMDSLKHETSPTVIGSDGVRRLDTDVVDSSRLKPTTFTTGLVYHITKQISVFGNLSNNRSLPNFNQRLIGADVPPMPEGEGFDAGLKFDLLDGKLYATVSYYTTDAKKTTEWGNIQTDITNRNTHVLDSLKAAGLITQADYDARLINANGYLQDREADGWEFSLIANPTRNWRVSANFSINNVVKSNIMSEVAAWADANSAWWLQKAAPQGGANMNLGWGDWDTLGAQIGWMDGYINDQVQFNGKDARGERKYGANLYTNYRFDSGFLKGFSIGGGGRAQSKNIIGMDGDEVIEGRGLFLMDASLGYDFETKVFGKKTKFDLQLNVNNLLDSDRYQVYTVAWWDSSRAERIGLQEPRKFTLTARVSF